MLHNECEIINGYCTLVVEPPLFSHRLLLLVTSTGFRSCPRESEKQRGKNEATYEQSSALVGQHENSRHTVASERNDGELKEWEQRSTDTIMQTGACLAEVENGTLTMTLTQFAFKTLNHNTKSNLGQAF